MNRAAPAVIFIATVKLRVIELTHKNLQLHHPALLVRLQIPGQTLLADEEVALRAAQEALRARRWLNFPGACRRREPEPQVCVAFQQARLSTHRHHSPRSHLIMPRASSQFPSLKIDSLWTGRGIGKWTPRRNQKIHRLGIEQLRVLEGRVLDLIVEVAPLVVADEVGADCLVAGTLGRPGLMLETTEKGLCNILFEVDARVLINDLLSHIFRKVLITDTQHIESDTVVQKLHLERLVRCDARSGV